MVQPALCILLLAVVAAKKSWEDDEEDVEDVRRAIPGEPGTDYPTLGAVPATSFSCTDRSEGFYADPETRCQVFHICSLQKGFMSRQSFLCPNGTVFNNNVNTCDWWNKVKCGKRQDSYKQPLGILNVGPKASERPIQEVIAVDRKPFYSSRSKTSKANIKTLSATPTNFNNLESRKNHVVKNREYTKDPYEKLDEVKGFDHSIEKFTNSLPTDRYHNPATETSISLLGTKYQNTPLPKNNRVTEVSIKPRVRYTHTLKSTSDNPIYSLNPLIHLARDSSLLSTFTKSSQISTHPVERYVVDDVLPQYKIDSPKSIPSSKEFPFGEGGDDNNGPNVPISGDIEKIAPSYNGNGLVAQEGKPSQDGNSKPVTRLYQSTKKGVETTRNLDYSRNDLNILRSTSPRYENSEDDFPPLIRVSSGYSFIPDSDKNNNFNTPRLLKVTNSYSVEDNGPTVNPSGGYKIDDNGLRNRLKSSDIEGNKHVNHQEVSNVSPGAIKNILQYGIGENQDIYITSTPALPENDNVNNITFINRFIIDEPNLQSPTPNSFNEHTSNLVTKAYSSEKLEKGYFPSSTIKPNFYPDVFQIKSTGETEKGPLYSGILPETNYASGLDNIDSASKPNDTPNVSYKNIPGHYITEAPPVVSSPTFNPTPKAYEDRREFDYSLSYESMSRDRFPFSEKAQLNHKPPEYISTTPSLSEVRGNVHANTQDTGISAKYVDEHEILNFSKPPPISKVHTQPPVSSSYQDFPLAQSPLLHNDASSPHDIPILRNTVSKAFTSLSTDLPFGYSSVQSPQSPLRGSSLINSGYISNKNTLLLQIQKSSSYPFHQQNYSAPANVHITPSDKSIEILDNKEKENILSGLKIANVLPAVEAYSWSTVITPPSPTVNHYGSSSSLANVDSTNVYESSTTPLPFSLDNNNETYFPGFKQEKVMPSTEAYPWSSSATPPSTTNHAYVPINTFSQSSAIENYGKNQASSFSISDQTTATFFSNKNDGSKFSGLNVANASPTTEPYSLTSAVNSPADTSGNSDFIYPDTSTDSKFLYDSLPLSISVHQKSSTSTESSFVTKPEVTHKYYNTLGSTPYLAPTERTSVGLTFSTPKPFLENQEPYVAPQRHSTILPDYKEEGKQLLNPADLLKINSLHRPTESTTYKNEQSAELVQSIGFSFDSEADREQFEIAKSKGWFSQK